MSGFSLDHISYNINNANKNRKKKEHGRHRHLRSSKHKHGHTHTHKHHRRSSKKVFGSLHDTCSVCLDDTTKLDTRLFPCKHAFHSECLATWVKASKNFDCPICRQKIYHFVQASSKTSNTNDELVRIWNEKHMRNDANKVTKDDPKQKLIELDIETELSSQVNTVTIKEESKVDTDIINNINSNDDNNIDSHINSNIDNNNKVSSTSLIWNYVWECLKASQGYNNINYTCNNNNNELGSRINNPIAYDESQINFHDAKVLKWVEKHKYIKELNTNLLIKHDDDINKENKIYNELKLNLKSGLCGGTFAGLTTFILSALLGNSFKIQGLRNALGCIEVIPRMGVYFTGYEYSKKYIFKISNDKHSNLEKFSLRFTSALFSSSIANLILQGSSVKFSPSIISLRFGAFFGLFECSKDILANTMNINNNELKFIDILSSAAVSGTIASSIYYPMYKVSFKPSALLTVGTVSLSQGIASNIANIKHNSTGFNNLYKGWGNHLLKWLPSCVVCSCAFEFSKRHFKQLNQD